jgi:hypothetical protein
VVSGAQQDIGAAFATVSLETARSEGAGMTADSRLHSVLDPGETWIYFGPGTDDAGNATSAFEAGFINSDGQLVCTADAGDTTACLTTLASGHTFAAYAVAAVSNFLYLIGGDSNDTDTPGGQVDGREGEIQDDSEPEVDNFNNLSASLTPQRALHAVALESSVIFVVGGQINEGAGDVPTTSTAFTPF